MNTSPVHFGSSRLLTIKNEFGFVPQKLHETVEHAFQSYLFRNNESPDAVMLKVSDPQNPLDPEAEKRIVINGPEAQLFSSVNSLAKMIALTTQQLGRPPLLAQTILNTVKGYLLEIVEKAHTEKGHGIDVLYMVDGPDNDHLRYGMVINSTDENGTREYTWD